MDGEGPEGFLLGQILLLVPFPNPDTNSKLVSNPPLGRAVVSGRANQLKTVVRCGQL